MRFALFSFWPEARRGALTGFGPLSSAGFARVQRTLALRVRRGQLFRSLGHRKGSEGIGPGNEDSTQTFPFLLGPAHANSFWQEILEPETQRGKFLTLTRMPRKTALIEPPVDDLSFEDFLGERLGAKSRKSLRYDQRKLAEQGDA